MLIETKFNMKDILKCSIAGYEGEVFAITKYATGCIHYALACKKLKPDGTIHELQWFDESNLEKVKRD